MNKFFILGVLSLFLNACPSMERYNVKPDAEFPYSRMANYPVTFKMDCNYHIGLEDTGLIMELVNQSRETFNLTKDDFVFIVDDGSSKDFNSRNWAFSIHDKLTAEKYSTPHLARTGDDYYNNQTLVLEKDKYALIRFELPGSKLDKKNFTVQLKRPKSTDTLFKAKCHHLLSK